MPGKTSPDIKRILAAGMRIAFHMALANHLDGRIGIQEITDSPFRGPPTAAPIAAAFPGAAFVGVSSIHRSGKVYLDHPSAITGAASRACRIEDAVSLDRNRLELL